MIDSPIKSMALVNVAIAISITAFTTVLQAQTLPSPCKTMYFGNLKLACFQPGSGGIVTGLQGTDASSIAAATPWCQTITPGSVTSATVPAPGTMACYQFTVSNQTALNVQASLPVGIVGSAELYNINANTSGFKLSESFYPANPLTTNYTTQFERIVLVVKATNGAGDAPMNIGVNVAPPALSNDTLASATSMAVNDTAYGRMIAPLGSAYYFYPLKNGQTTALIRATFTANQQVAYRFVQKTGAGTYNIQPEMVLMPAQNDKNIAATSPYPVNTATTTTPAGVIVRVTSVNSVAPPNEAFTVRVGIADVTIATYELVNTETISRWYPTNPVQLQAATYITSNALVTDVAGNPVKGQDVALKVTRNQGDGNAVQNFIYRTDDSGRISITTPLPACTGTVIARTNYGPPGSPADRWNGTGQQGNVKFDVSSGISGSVRSQPFYRICSETYLGLR